MVSLSMNMMSKQKWMKYSTVLGSILTILPNGLYLYWGNMSTYCLSYIAIVADSKANINTPWVISLYLVFLPLGVSSANFIASKIGRRHCVVIGVILSNVGIFSSYFTVQISVLALTSTLGIILGFGTGLSNGSCLQLVVEWANKDVGKLTSIVQNGFPLGAMLINQFMTLMMNPNGHVPEVALGRVKYFAQKDIMDRVPSIFLVLGIISVSVHVIGLCLIKQRPKEEIILLEKSTAREDSYSTFPTEPEDAKAKKALTGSTKHVPVPTDQTYSQNVSTAPEKDRTPRDYHPKEMLKTASFYTMWISYAIGDLPFLLFGNYYKFFGQMWIQNDLLLSVLGTAVIFLNGFANVMWGAAMDKFGVKNCLAFLMSSVIVILSWYYFTPMVHAWFYFAATLLFGCFADSLYPCFTVATALLFGKTHFSTNFGIVMTANVFLNFVAPSILDAVLTHFGFHGLFTFASSTTLISLVLILIFIPRV